MPRHSGTPVARRFALSEADAEDLRQLLRQRLRVLAKILGGVFGTFLLLKVLAVVFYLRGDVLGFLLNPGMSLNAAGVGALFAVVQSTKSDHRTMRQLHALDHLSSLAMGLGSAMMVLVLPKGFGLEPAAMLILVLTLVLRAGLVPSTAQHTALVGIASFVPLLVAAAWAFRREPLPPPLTPWIATMAYVAWAAAVVAATAKTSEVIFGLHQQIRHAMRLGQYTLAEKIGEGGMGTVYRAKHALLRRPTAIKLLSPERAGSQNLVRFEREVQLTASLTHPNTVAIYDYGRTPDGVFYYAMEYLDGPSLEELVRKHGPQPPARVIHLLEQVASALVEAHEIGLVHRDVKPANILMCRRGGEADVVKVLDFGLVKSTSPSDDVTLTHADMLTGTPLYLAPESIQAPETIDARVDVYALGAVGYYLLTGRPVFEGRTLVEVCSHHLLSAPVAPSKRIGQVVPECLERTILRCLEKDRALRPTSRELRTSLRAAAIELPWTEEAVAAWWANLAANPASQLEVSPDGDTVMLSRDGEPRIVAA